jgi:hypothetical protein
VCFFLFPLLLWYHFIFSSSSQKKMCILNRPVKEVLQTSIFCAKSGSRQLTIYSNKVATTVENAMILPFPLRHKDPTDEEELEFYDISSLGETLFRALNAVFIDTSPPRQMKSKSRSRAAAPQTLAVHEVGSYLASKCYSIDDLKRIDASVFTLASDVETLLRSEYPTGFGFVVCKLKQSLAGEKYEPFAYSHYLPEGREETLFIPTKHFHKHVSTIAQVAEAKADWDHNIFIYNYQTGLPSFINEDKWEWNKSLPMELNDLQRLTVSFETANSFQKISLKGDHPNRDLYVQVTA